MKLMKKRAISIALAGFLLFSGGLIAKTRGPSGFLPYKPIIASTETIDITINGVA